MKRTFVRWSIVFIFVGLSDVGASWAAAPPTFKQIKPDGGGLQLLATNPSDEGFNCTAYWSVTGNELGQEVTKSMHGSFFVKAHAENEIVLNGGTPALTDVSEITDASVPCSPASAPTIGSSPEASGGPQGSYSGSCANCSVAGETLKCGDCYTGNKGNIFGQSSSKPSSINFKQCADHAVKNDHGNLTCDHGPAGPPFTPMQYLITWSDTVPLINSVEGVGPARYPNPMRCACVHAHSTGRYPDAHTVTLTNECGTNVSVLAEQDSQQQQGFMASSPMKAAAGKQFAVAAIGMLNSIIFNVDGNKFVYLFPLECSGGQAVTGFTTQPPFTNE